MNTAPGAKESRLAKALALVERTAAAMCYRPDVLRMDVELGNVAARVRLTAHPDDGGRLVGDGGECIAALYSIAKLLAFGSGRTIKFDQVGKTADPSEGYPKFRYVEDWDEAKALALATDLVAVCFPGQETTVGLRPGKDNSIDLIFGLEDAGGTRALAFGKAASVLFIPIGKVLGRVINADVEPL